MNPVPDSQHPAWRRRPPALLLGAALLASCSSPMPPRPTSVTPGDEQAVWQHLESMIAAGMRTEKATGLSIAVVDDQRVLWSKGFGWADAGKKLPASDQTVYRMGSISKLFTTVAALQLAQDGRLSLDAPIQSALPGFRVNPPPGQPAITPRALMSHHAGLTRDVGQGMWGHQVGPFRDMVMALQPDDQSYPAGLLFSYSNVGMTVLGAAVEQVAQEPFERLLQRRVLTPLGMGTASFTTALPAGAARPYKGGQAANEPSLRDTPAGGLNASVQDMSRFMMMVFANGKTRDGHELLTPASLAEMLRVQNAGNPLDMDMRTGLGWMLNSIGPDTLRNAGLVAHHGGATPHYATQMYLLPEHKLGVIVASNSANTSTLVDAVAKRALDLVLEAKKGIRQPPPASGFEPPPTGWTEAQMRTWEGHYTTIAGHARVARSGNSLLAHTGDRVLTLLPGADGSAGLRYKLLGIVPLPIGALEQVTLLRRQVQGRELLVARSGGQELLLGERITPQDQTLAAGWLGTYQPVGPGSGGTTDPVDSITLYLDHQALIARVHMAESEGGEEEFLPVRIVSDREARALRGLADHGDLVRLQTIDGQPGFEASGLRFVRTPP
jgi:CubicO group peptidase (beta-lactamase class C family)